MIRFLTWNTEWATPRSRRTVGIRRRFDEEAAEVAVLTETQLALAQERWPQIADAGPHPGSGQPKGSKVVVASNLPMTAIDTVGSKELPPNNFVCVDIDDGGGEPLRVIGVVVRWRERARYLDALPDALDRLVTARTVVAGDFNLPMTGDARLERRMQAILGAHQLRVVTARAWPELQGERPLIDHIAIGERLDVEAVHVWPRLDAQTGLRLTDHAGAACALR